MFEKEAEEKEAEEKEVHYIWEGFGEEELPLSLWEKLLQHYLITEMTAYRR